MTLTASRTDALYTIDEDDLDCVMLAQTMDADLPYNVIRIRAEDDTGQATSFRWKLPRPDVGFLLRDDPTLDSAGGAFAVQGFCGEVGSGCILTKETIDSYHLPSILYAGPTCETGLPRNTQKQFSGEAVRIRVKAEGQRGKASKGTVDVGYGRLGTPVLWVSNGRGEPASGIGTQQIATFLDPTFSVTLEPTIMPPASIQTYHFDNGGGDDDDSNFCGLDGAALGAPACTRLEYESAGTYKPRVEVQLVDGSAYCDNATVRVITCRPRTKLDVDRSPRRRAYRSGDGEPEEITVTLRNQASRSDGCPFILDRLTCRTEARRKTFNENTRITFVPARCEGNTAIFCDNDFDCGGSGPCINASHCSTTTSQRCTADRECEPPRCPTCESGEECTRVIRVPRTIFPGESVELLNELVDLRSVVSGPVKITETWAVTERFDRGNDSTTDHYKIRPPRP